MHTPRSTSKSPALDILHHRNPQPLALGCPQAPLGLGCCAVAARSLSQHRFVALGQHRRDLFFPRSVVLPKSNRELSTVRLVIKRYSMRVRIVVPLVVVLSTSVTMHAGVQAAVVPGARWIGTTHRDLRSETMHVRSDQSEVRCANNAWLTCSIREMTTNSRTWQKERSTVYCTR